MVLRESTRRQRKLALGSLGPKPNVVFAQGRGLAEPLPRRLLQRGPLLDP